jgi:hypothetical protein
MSGRFSKLEPGDTVRMTTGIFAKRRRMAGGKRKTLWVQLGDPTNEERERMKRLLIQGKTVVFNRLVKEICFRYQSNPPESGLPPIAP